MDRLHAYVTAQLQPPQRLPLLTEVLGRFFKFVAVSVVVIIVSGLTPLLTTGFAQAPLHWHIMLSTGMLMSVIFAVIYWLYYPRLKASVAAQNWPSAGVSMNHIRILVVVNLGLGAATLAIATLGQLFGG